MILRAPRAALPGISQALLDSGGTARPALRFRLNAQYNSPSDHRFASSSTRSSPTHQLKRVRQLIDEIGPVKSTAQRLAILKQYSDIKDLLELIYDPNIRFHVTSRGLTSLITSNPDAQIHRSEAVPDSLSALLAGLAQGEFGGQNKSITHAFLQKNGIDVGTPEYDVFGKLLDRHLQMGVSRNTIQKVQWGDGVGTSSMSAERGRDSHRTATPEGEEPVTGTGETASIARSAASTTSAAQPKPTAPRMASGEDGPGQSRARSLKAFSCALGQTILPPFKELSKRSHKWYASRKLDGIRVLALLDFYVPHDLSEPLAFHTAQFVSRQGNPFHSLANLQEQLEDLASYPKLRELLDRDPVVIDVPGEEGSVKRLVLDGEVCSMVPITQPLRTGDDGTGASALWENNGITEDFSSAVSLVKRHATMDQPMYFVFDVCPWIEVSEGEAQGRVGEGLGKTFGERSEDVKDLCDWLRQHVRESRTGEEPRIRGLVQWPIEAGDVDGMVERAAAEGWEGLIFRADAPYKGKRSADIRKFKKFQDAEYTVVDMDTSSMRLSVDGVYGIHEALSNVWIEHEGHRVSVGTGFTTDERIRFAKDPSQIVGKQITVEYFSESAAVGREGAKSLRFPRIKQIWGEGGRNI